MAPALHVPGIRQLWLTPAARTIALSTLIARLPKGILPLAIVYHVHARTGSYAIAGLAAAALAVGDASSAPLQGRMIDRYGRAPILTASIVAHIAALLALAGLAEAPAWALVGCTLLAGIGFPPVSGAVKAIWAELADSETLPAAYTLESLIQQVIFISGPLFVAAVLVVASPGAALLVAAGLTGVGTIAFTFAARRFHDRTAPTHGGRVTSALRVRAVRTLALTTVAQGVAFGALPVVLPSFAAAADASQAGGVLLMAFAVGGLLGTFVPARMGYVRLLAWLAAALAPLALLGIHAAPLTVVLAGLVLAVAGLLLTPVAATCYVIMGRATSPRHRTEGFTWLSTAMACGTAAGSALVGAGIDRFGPAIAMPVPMLAIAAAAVVAFVSFRASTTLDT